MWAARSGGLDVIALTDHDTCGGIDEALASLPDNLHLIPGIELSTTLDHTELHILGYFIDHKHPDIVAHATSAALKRAERVRRIVEKLRDYKVNLSFDDVISAADGAPGVLARPHVARAMVNKGYVQSVSEAFDRFLGDDGPCFLPTELLLPHDAITLIRAAGGLAVWAHPNGARFDEILPCLVNSGIDGLECIRPRMTPPEIRFFQETANRYGLLISGGSDWHGSWHGKLGEFFVRANEVETLLGRGGF